MNRKMRTDESKTPCSKCKHGRRILKRSHSPKWCVSKFLVKISFSGKSNTPCKFYEESAKETETGGVGWNGK